MSRESAWWRSSTERYGRYWGQQQKPTIEMGEWEIEFNDKPLGIEYLKITDEVTGLIKVKQIKILERTIRLDGNFKEFVGTVMENLIANESLVEEIEVLVEMAFFVAEIFRIQEEEEHEWVIKNGRGNRSKIIDSQNVLFEVIQELEDKGKINRDMAVKMTGYWQEIQQEDQLMEEGKGNKVLI